jgi:hypothetical protein
MGCEMFTTRLIAQVLGDLIRVRMSEETPCQRLTCAHPGINSELVVCALCCRAQSARTAAAIMSALPFTT